MKAKSGETTKAKNNAQSALTLKKIIKGKKTKKQKIDIGKIIKHFENHFTDQEADEIAKELTSFYRPVNESEVREAVKKLSNNKTPGPDEVTSEDLKKSDPKKVTKTLNDMLRERDEKLLNTLVNPLSTHRKFISLIIRKRVNPEVRESECESW